MRGTSDRVARRRAEDRERILRAAAQQFAERGVERVRLDELVEAADVARGTLYTHFETKDALVHAIVEPQLRMTVDRLRPALTKPDPLARLDAMIDVYVELFTENRDALRVCYQATGASMASLPALAMEHLEQVNSIFRAVQRTGRLRIDDAQLSARTMARVAIPLLELYSSHPEGMKIFKESVRGLLLKEAPARPKAR